MCKICMAEYDEFFEISNFGETNISGVFDQIQADTGLGVGINKELAIGSNYILVKGD